MIRAFEASVRPYRYEVVIFTDGSVAARSYGPVWDAAGDATLTFEGVSEAEEEMDFKFPDGSSEPLQTAALLELLALTGVLLRAHDRRGVAALVEQTRALSRLREAHEKVGAAVRGKPAAPAARYEPTEETDEP